jgi:hypothetical protein
MSSMPSGYFNEDTVVELARVAKSEGWDQMVRDAYLFVTNNCDWEDSDDKHHLIKVLLQEVSVELKIK